MTFDARETSRESGARIHYVAFERSGAYYRYTTAELEQTFNGELYAALKGFGHSALEQNSEDISMQVKFSLPRTAAIAAEFVGAPSPAPMNVTVWANHRGEADVEAILIWQGEVSSVTFAGNSFELLCSSELSAFSRQLGGHVFARACPIILYGPLCGVDKTLHTFNATVAAVSADGLTVTVTGPADLGATPRNYIGGQLIWGARIVYILTEGAAGVFTMQTSVAGLPVGLVVQIRRGCNRTPAMCDGVFNNLDRYAGFKKIPLRNIWRRMQ